MRPVRSFMGAAFGLLFWAVVIGALIHSNNRPNDNVERPEPSSLVHEPRHERHVPPVSDHHVSMPHHHESIPRLNLRDALDQRKIEVEAKGGGLSSATLTVTLKSDESLIIVVSAGIVFRAASDRLQNMMVVRDVEIQLDIQRRKQTRSIGVKCMNMNRAEPQPSDVLTIDDTVSGDLQKLIASNEFQKAGSSIQQFAVWTITDNPLRNGYVGIGYFGFGSGPNDGDISKVRELLVAAGIEPERYRAFATAAQLDAMRKERAQREKEKRETALRQQPATQSQQEKAQKTKTLNERRRFEILLDETRGGKRFIKVLFLSDDAYSLSEAEITKIADELAKKKQRATIHFFLPAMDPSMLPWATANSNEKKKLHVMMFRDRRPK